MLENEEVVEWRGKETILSSHRHPEYYLGGTVESWIYDLSHLTQGLCGIHWTSLISEKWFFRGNTLV